MPYLRCLLVSKIFTLYTKNYKCCIKYCILVTPCGQGSSWLPNKVRSSSSPECIFLLLCTLILNILTTRSNFFYLHQWAILVGSGFQWKTLMHPIHILIFTNTSVIDKLSICVHLVSLVIKFSFVLYFMAAKPKCDDYTAT